MRKRDGRNLNNDGISNVDDNRSQLPNSFALLEIIFDCSTQKRTAGSELFVISELMPGHPISNR